MFSRLGLVSSFYSRATRRKLDQVMMDEGIAKFVIKKHNLKDYAVHRRIKTDEAWHELLRPYFHDSSVVDSLWRTTSEPRTWVD